MHGVCEFDGRVSVATLGDRYFIYVRANPASGARYVSVAQSSHPSGPWGKLRFIEIKGWSSSAILKGNLYVLGLS